MDGVKTYAKSEGIGVNFRVREFLFETKMYPNYTPTNLRNADHLYQLGVAAQSTLNLVT